LNCIIQNIFFFKFWIVQSGIQDCTSKIPNYHLKYNFFIFWIAQSETLFFNSKLYNPKYKIVRGVGFYFFHQGYNGHFIESVEVQGENMEV